MDVVRFGRWLADRRRDRGWASQHALAVAAQAHPRTSNLAISEAFLARLEAGLLVHPFRGAVRRRVVGLAWLLCGSARRVRDYIKVAELGSLTRAETAEIDALVRSFAEALPPQQALLPPPPPCLIGREDSLAGLIAALTDPQVRGRCCLISGLPGVGKTSLALAAAHQLAGAPQGPASFSDGIVFITCRGRHGAHGAQSILEDMLAFRQPYSPVAAPQSDAATYGAHAGRGDTSAVAHTLARTADHVRSALAGKRMLILLDGVEADLPLDQMLDALLPHSFSLTPPAGVPHDVQAAAPVLLMTSSCAPPDASHLLHIHLQPLVPDDGVRLIEQALGTTLDGEDRQAALRLCAATGGVPAAIKTAATTLAQGGVPLGVLAGAAERNPLVVYDGASGAGSAIARSLAALPPAMQAQLALLSVLQTESFGLAAAAALRPEPPHSAVMLTSALVRRSLLEPEQGGEAGTSHGARFRLPPLVRAYAIEQARSLPVAAVASARKHLSAYADAYVERYAADMRAMAAEAPVLWAALRYAANDGEHERTLRLACALLPLALQHETCGRIERLLRDAIRAGKALADRQALARCLNLLGVIRFFREDYASARRAWMECLRIAGDARTPDTFCGAAYLNLADLADLDGESDAAWHLGELGILYSRKAGFASATAGALAVQAERARRSGKLRIAHTYASEGLDLIVASGLEKSPGHWRACAVEARLELARIERDYAAARTYADQYLGFTGSEFRLFLAEDLIDQAEYALEAGANQDAIKLLGHALAIADDAQATALLRRVRAVKHRAERPDLAWHGRASGE